MKKIKLPLEMANGVQVRTLDELKENWDLEKALNYYLNGKLQTWLIDRYYTELAGEVDALSGITDNAELQQKLCGIFGIEIKEDFVDVEAVAERNRRLEILRQYTADDAVLKNVDKVAFNQEELAYLLDEGNSKIYLFNNKFSIPLTINEKTYVGVGDVEVVINSKNYVNFDNLNIKFKNIKFDKEYEKLALNAPEVNYKLGEEYEAKKDYLNALKYYLIAAENGSGKAWTSLGDLYYSGKGIEINKKKAFECYDKGSELSDYGAIGSLAVCYINGDGVNKNFDKGYMLLEKAAEAGNNNAIDNLGYIYWKGIGSIKKDENIAQKWFMKAADKGYLDSIKHLAYLYWNDGCGESFNFDNAKKWFLKAAELGDLESIRMLAVIADRIGNVDEAINWYQKAINKNDTNAMIALAWIYRRDGSPGYPPIHNYSEAMRLFKMAADAGNTYGLINIGDMYFDGRGVQESRDEAMKWYKKAFDLGNKDAEQKLNRIF